jgi:hypothetical protein
MGTAMAVAVAMVLRMVGLLRGGFGRGLSRWRLHAQVEGRPLAGSRVVHDGRVRIAGVFSVIA